VHRTAESWRETKNACLIAARSQTFGDDIQPKPPDCSCDPKHVAKIAETEALSVAPPRPDSSPAATLKERPGVGLLLEDTDWHPRRLVRTVLSSRNELEIMTPNQYVDQLAEGSVDTIRFAHVLEHLIAPKAAVDLAARKLRTGGILYITQPGFPVLRPKRTDFPLKDSVFPNHLHYFSPISLIRLVDGLRLQVEKLFSVTRCDEVYHELAHLIDLRYARKRLAEVSQKGERVRGERANYPFYTEENSAFYLRKTG